MHFHIGGWILIVLGCAFLLQNLGILPIHLIGHIWPIILIVIGISIIMKKQQGKKPLE